MSKIFCRVLMLCLSLASIGANAEFSLDKYRIVLDDKQRRTDLRVYNTGQQFSSYRVQMVDMSMDEKGNLNKVDNFAHSAKKLLRVGPRLAKNVTPQGYQKIRVRARGSKEDGEFRTHLIIEELLPPYEGDVQGMILRPNFKIIIPIFVTTGELKAQVTADTFEFNDKTQELTFMLHRTGNASVFGNIVFTNTKGEVVHRQNGIGIYREVDKRSLITKFPETVKSIKGLTFKLEKPDDETVLFQSTL